MRRATLVLALTCFAACTTPSGTTDGGGAKPDPAVAAAAAQRAATQALEAARAARKAADARKAELALRADAAELNTLAATTIFAGAAWDEAVAALAAAEAALTAKNHADAKAAADRATAGFDGARQASVDASDAIAKRAQALAARTAWVERFGGLGLEEPAGTGPSKAAEAAFAGARYAEAAKGYGEAGAAYTSAMTASDALVDAKLTAIRAELEGAADPWARAVRAAAIPPAFRARAEIAAVAQAAGAWRLVVTADVAHEVALGRADAPAGEVSLALGRTGVDFAFVPPGRYVLSVARAGAGPAMTIPLDLTREATPREVVLALDDAPEGMVLVPAASGTGAPGADNPRDFWIDRLEVTREDFARYLAATGDTAPMGWSLTRAPRTGEAKLPAITITLEQAGFYALWAGKRLPWLVEWDKAARGGDGRAFPWGTEPREGATVTATANGLPGEVGARAADTSPYGALDLSGNAAEYGLLPDATEPGSARILGGSYLLPPDQARFDAAPRVSEASSVAIDAGIRCARRRLVDQAGAPLTPESALAEGTSPGAMIEAMRRLGLRGDAAAREELFARVGAPDVWVHRAARFYLATSGAGASEFLAEHLATDDPDIKRRALLAIVGTPVTTHDALLPKAIASLDDAGRALAYERLARRASADFAATYVAGLNDANEKSRARCLEALASCFAEDRVSPVAAKLDDPSALVRTAAALCLMRWGRIELFERLLLLYVNTPASEQARRGALLAHMPYLGLDPVIAGLVAQLPKAPQAVGVQALHLLGLMGGAQHTDALAAGLSNKSTGIAAVVALSFVKTDKACAALTQILPQDQLPPQFRRPVAQCLAACRYAPALAVLGTLMNKVSLPIEERLAYADAIARIGGPEAHAILGRAIETQGHPLAGQLELIVAYARSRHPTAVANLKSALDAATAADRPVFLGLLALAGDASVKAEIEAAIRGTSSLSEAHGRMCLLAGSIFTADDVSRWLASPRVADQLAGALAAVDAPELPAPDRLFERFPELFPSVQERLIGSLRQRQAYECVDAVHALLARWTDAPTAIVPQLRALEGELLRAQYRVAQGGKR